MNLKKLVEMVAFRNIYIPALALVALFALFAYINVEKIIYSIHDDGKLINTSGQQRMLSQNLVLLGFEYLNNPSETNRFNLKKNIELMRASHEFLINSYTNDKLKFIYNEKQLSAKLNNFLEKFDTFVKDGSNELIIELSSDAKLLLPLLFEAVQEYENINHIKITNLEHKQFLILIITLILLIFEVAFIFFPASRQIKKYTDDLKDFNNMLAERVRDEVKKNREKDKQMIQQSRLAQMGEMISMIAHQWRQPLGAISSVSSTIELEAMLDSLDKEKSILYAKKITQLTQHLSQTINDFREFFKPDKEKEDITCKELTDGVLSIIGSSLQTNNINLIQELNCHTSFKTYSNELKQVILNIIANAKDALLDKKVEKPYIKISSSIDDNKYFLRISDNAGGVAKENLDKIFDPYFSTKKEKNGTGLGLYMSKTIIEDHCKGNLSVYNDSQGAVFTITIPIY